MPAGRFFFFLHLLYLVFSVILEMERLFILESSLLLLLFKYYVPFSFFPSRYSSYACITPFEIVPSLSLFVSGCAGWLVESQFPDQGLNLGLGSESPES